MKKISNLRAYLGRITGRSDPIHFTGRSEVDLPRYIGGLYELHQASLLGIPAVLAILRSGDVPSVIEMSRHYELLKTRTGAEVVFVTDVAGQRTGERLIHRRIPHIVIGRQIFLPFLLLDIKATGRLLAGNEAPQVIRLSQGAEVLLIRQLLRGDLNGLSGADLARMTSLSAMTAQRAVGQLVAANVCQLEAEGQRKILRFADKASLWLDAVKILTPPLSKIVMLESLPPALPTYVAGATALARSTLLADDEIPVFATSRRHYSRLDHPRSVPTEDAKVRLEIWDREPALTANDGVVDPISLYLNMRDGDDRVRIALAELLQQHDLGVPS